MIIDDAYRDDIANVGPPVPPPPPLTLLKPWFTNFGRNILPWLNWPSVGPREFEYFKWKRHEENC